MPKISIVVPVYNVEKYIYRCIHSLQNQTLKDIEIILVDDESPDNSPAICDKFALEDSRIKVIHKKNQGLGMARNSGLEMATGEFVAFIDSDDFLDLKTYEVVYHKAQEKNLDTCFFRFCRYYSDGKIQQFDDSNREEYFENKKEINRFLLEMVGPKPCYSKSQKYSMSSCKAIYKLSLINQYKIRFISEKEVASEDLIFHLDYLPHASKIGYLPYEFYYYFVNTNSITTTYSEEKYERLIKSLQVTEKRLGNLFSYQEYKDHYYSHVIRIYRVIIKFEVLGKTSFKIKINKIKQHCASPILKRMYDDISRKEYSFINQLYLFCLEKRIVLFFILLYNLKNRLKIK